MFVVQEMECGQASNQACLSRNRGLHMLQPVGWYNTLYVELGWPEARSNLS